MAFVCKFLAAPATVSGIKTIAMRAPRRKVRNSFRLEARNQELLESIAMQSGQANEASLEVLRYPTIDTRVTKGPDWKYGDSVGHGEGTFGTTVAKPCDEYVSVKSMLARGGRRSL